MYEEGIFYQQVVSHLESHIDLDLLIIFYDEYFDYHSILIINLSEGIFQVFSEMEIIIISINIMELLVNSTLCFFPFLEFNTFGYLYIIFGLLSNVGLVILIYLRYVVLSFWF